MTTISKAVGQGGNFTIKGQLVSKQIFFKQRNGRVDKLLIEVIVDENGQLLEAKTWRPLKAYTVHGKFEPNDCIEISGPSRFGEPNRKFSLANYEIYSNWMIRPIDEFKLKVGLKCFSQIANYSRCDKKPAHVVGLFSELVRGPVRQNSRGYVLVQGYYLRLIDEQCRSFQVLVWVNPKLEKNKKGSLKNCEPDDVILILSAREQEERYKKSTAGFYTLTTTYPAVVNPTCISPQVYLNLRRSRQSLQSECCIKFEPKQ